MKLIVKKKCSLLTLHTPAMQVDLIAFRVQSIVHETAIQRRLIFLVIALIVITMQGSLECVGIYNYYF